MPPLTALRDTDLKAFLTRHSDLLLAAIVGVVAGLGAVAVRELISLGQWIFWGSKGDILESVALVQSWRIVLIPCLGGLLVGDRARRPQPDLRRVPEARDRDRVLCHGRDAHAAPGVSYLSTFPYLVNNTK